MNVHFSDTVQRLLELNRLADELEQLQLHREPSTDTVALIESLRSNISLTVLIQHDRLRARGRKSLVKVQHGVCSGCHVSLPLGTVSELKRRELVTCGNCGRFVFLAAEDTPSTPTTEIEKAPRRRSGHNRETSE